ncbi:AMP-binding protein [Nocardia jiangxiensis]|uniref:AMP-binding protein n=1 Tax=Nocardia jiangxiensis TaxID=282685 RepID=UPI00031EB24C|nr:AMP-binding protein [Nocardia jiangxiensis]
MRTVPLELAERYEREGWWTRDSIGELLAGGLAASSRSPFRVHSAVRPWLGSVGEVERVARRLAAGLRARGVVTGDVIAFQLPNWMEAAATFWAAEFLGAVVVPIVHIYGRKEVGYILEAVRPRVFVTAERFGKLVYDPAVCEKVPIVGVVGGQDAATEFDALLADAPLEGVAAVDPTGPALIAFTSGTTNAPKGVVHSHQTLGCETRQLSARRPADFDPQLTVAPVGHFIGMLSAFLVPVLEGTAIDLVDVWDPEVILNLMTTVGSVVSGGVPYYMTSLLDHPKFTSEHLELMKYAGLGGAPVPIAIAERLTALGIKVVRSYGSTEHPSMTGSKYSVSVDKRLYTDGVPEPGVEIRLSTDGEILSRGPDLCIGYTDDDLTDAKFDADGWYHSGDVGTLDADGYLTITDRTADLIIRGGENVSALEVEDVLVTVPGVAEAVAVAAPDSRLGEHVAAVLRLHPMAVAPTLESLRAHFADAGLARQKWPEEVHVVADFPRTASGKVQKFLVRASLQA